MQTLLGQQRPNLRIGQGRHVAEFGFAQRRLAQPFDHPPVSHQGHFLRSKADLELLHRVQKGRGIARVAPVELNGNGFPVPVGQQPSYQLFLTFLAVPIIPKIGQLVFQPLKVRAGHVIEINRSRGRGRRFGGQDRFDARLALLQVLQCGVEIVFIKGVHLKDFFDRVVLAPPRCRQAAALMRQSGVDQEQGQTLQAGLLAHRLDQPDLPSQAIQGS